MYVFAALHTQSKFNVLRARVCIWWYSLRYISLHTIKMAKRKFIITFLLQLLALEIKSEATEHFHCVSTRTKTDIKKSHSEKLIYGDIKWNYYFFFVKQTRLCHVIQLVFFPLFPSLRLNCLAAFTFGFMMIIPFIVVKTHSESRERSG